MPLPVLVYGLLSGHGIWWPVNLLAGMVIPGVGGMSGSELEQFNPGLLIAGILIHIVVSLVLGLIYGVLLPMLPDFRKPLAWGALLMPLLWTAASYVAFSVMNPTVRDGGRLVLVCDLAVDLRHRGRDCIHAVRKSRSNPSRPGRRRGRRNGNADPCYLMESRGRARNLVSGQLARGDGDTRRNPANRGDVRNISPAIGSWRRLSCTQSFRWASDWRLRLCCRGCQLSRERLLGVDCSCPCSGLP